MLHFMTVTHPDEFKDQNRQRRLRQHAIRHGIERTRSERRKKHGIFVPVQYNGPQEEPSAGSELIAATLVRQPSQSFLDPLGASSILPGRMSDLMKNSEQHHFLFHGFLQSLGPTLEGAATSLAFVSAISLVPVQATNINISTVELLSYRGALLTGLRSNMRKPGWMPKVSSLSAMLLLIGYEYGIDGANSTSIVTHLRGLQTMLRSYRSGNNTTTLEDIRRALFWQDLTNCLVAGAPRLLSHTDFRDLEYFRDGDDVFDERLERGEDIPCGLASYVHQWPKTFTSILEDLGALCKVIDAKFGKNERLPVWFPISRYQANLESRVVDVLCEMRTVSEPESSYDSLCEACAFAAYLCTYKLSTGIWVGCYTPEVCVNQIIRCVMEAVRDAIDFAHQEVICWLLYVSGAFTVRKEARAQVAALMRNFMRDYPEEYVKDWEMMRHLLRRYIWNEWAMNERLFNFWNVL